MSQTVTKQDFDKFSLKMFKHFDSRFDDMDQKFENLRGDFRNLQSAVDAYAKQVEIYHHESVARDSQMARHERWIEQIAKASGVKLNY